MEEVWTARWSHEKSDTHSKNYVNVEGEDARLGEFDNRNQICDMESLYRDLARFVYYSDVYSEGIISTRRKQDQSFMPLG